MSTARETKVASERVVYEDPVLYPIRTLKPHPKNPRMGDVDAVAESLLANGQYKPVVIQRRDKDKGKGKELRLCAGHHTVKAAHSLGWKEVGGIVLDVTDEEAERILLVDNLSADKGEYAMDVLAEILESRSGAYAGTGFSADDARSIMASIEDQNHELLAATMNKPAVVLPSYDGDDDDEDFEERLDRAQETIEGKKKAVKALLGQDVVTDHRDAAKQDEELAALQERFERIVESGIPAGEGYWGIPELRTDMLVEGLPDKIDTWARWDVTPDDGETTWVYNYGVTNATKLPWDRTLLSFFTYDEKFEVWWNDPSYRTAMAYMAGCRQAIVPDYSMFGTDPRFLHLQAHYKSMWLGRFFQEAGMRVMPRLHFDDVESLRYAMDGIPQNAPVVAVCFQAGGTRNPDQAHEATETYEAMRLMVKQLKPQSILLYGGNPALKVIEKARLPKSIEVRHIENFAAKRRGSVFDVARGKDAVRDEGDEERDDR